MNTDEMWVMELLIDGKNWEKFFVVIRRGPTERPYMTELGPRGVQEWCHMKRRELCVFSPDLQPLPIRRFTPGQVTQDLLHLMIGIPSHLFVINKVCTDDPLHNSVKLWKCPI